MSAWKGTPGPWRVREDAPSMVSAGDDDIAEVCEWWPASAMHEAQANRDAIAAVPQLIEALTLAEPLLANGSEEHAQVIKALEAAGVRA